MGKYDAMKDQKFVFGSILIVSNLMDTILERELKEYGITAKQWFLTVVMENSFDHPPTIKEVAKAMGTSHQNVKQLALKLAAKDFLVLEKDIRDARVTRLSLTGQSHVFSQTIQAKAARFTKVLFAGIGDDDISGARKSLQTMMSNLTDMDQPTS